VSDGDGVEATPLTVDADLTLTVGGADATLRSTGERLFVEFPSLTAAVRALRSFPPAERRRLHAVLTAADLTLEVRARNRTLVVLGADARSGPTAWLTGLDPAEIRLCAPLSAAWGRVTAAVGRGR